MDEGSRPDGDTPKRIRRSLAEFYAGERFPAPDTDEGQLIYDVALSLRGWGPAAFATVTPDFLAAARWSIFLEGVMPIWRNAQATLMEEMPRDPVAKGLVANRKIAAQEFIEDWRPVLFPEPDDAG